MHSDSYRAALLQRGALWARRLQMDISSPRFLISDYYWKRFLRSCQLKGPLEVEFPLLFGGLTAAGTKKKKQCMNLTLCVLPLSSPAALQPKHCCTIIGTMWAFDSSLRFYLGYEVWFAVSSELLVTKNRTLSWNKILFLALKVFYFVKLVFWRYKVLNDRETLEHAPSFNTLRGTFFKMIKMSFFWDITFK